MSHMSLGIVDCSLTRMGQQRAERKRRLTPSILTASPRAITAWSRHRHASHRPLVRAPQAPWPLLVGRHLRTAASLAEKRTGAERCASPQTHNGPVSVETACDACIALLVCNCERRIYNANIATCYLSLLLEGENAGLINVGKGYILKISCRSHRLGVFRRHLHICLAHCLADSCQRGDLTALLMGASTG